MKSIVIRVYGIVQGVGFRPFTARTARELGLTGSVANKGSYVEIHAQGEQEALDLFLDRLQTQAPERAAVLRIDREEIDRECIGGMGRFGAGESCGADCEAERRSGGSEGGFFIIESERERGDIFVSPDIAMCPQCEAELTDASNRRWRHPFINCTACGPRLTILEAMPYDRERTSMKMFPMCRACASEYRDPRSRRYDAQPVCCPDCGPQVYLLERETAEEETFGCETLPGLQAESVQRTECGPQAESVQWKKSLYGAAAIRAARAAIMEGKIVAVKGIGGFHLCCDARNEVAVQRLRERKHRPVKPFAVMMRDLETVEQECVVEPAMLPLLTGHEKPILLLEKREDSECAESKRREQSGREGGFPAATRPLSAKIAPGNPKIGVMLPYAPLQTLLFCGDEEECGSGKKQECES
ncbi:MAG: Sua5/YciO/YrdC/YwlC family protein, partial [Eubacteriales bacterium]|nr:Sua5/YciO/YrdC/YwlC family protein [Eubacteriales bacterium]